MAKKPKVPVSEGGSAAALKHNPFGALAGASAPAREPEHETEPASRDENSKLPRGRLVLRRETKQRGGKTVVVVSGFASRADLTASAIAELAKHLKQELGCGGSVESSNGEHEIIVQGDQPARVAELLAARGFRVAGVTK